jgi:uncharacterized membrane protein
MWMLNEFPMQNVHPLFVHFPIALYLTACVLTVVGVCSQRGDAHRAAMWNLGLALIMAVIAVRTGQAAASTATPHSFTIPEVMMQHERVGLMFIWGLAALVLWRALRKGAWPQQRVEQAAQGLMMCVLAVLLTYGAHMGGRLVYQYGVGTTVPPALGIQVHPQPTDEPVHKHEDKHAH